MGVSINTSKSLGVTTATSIQPPKPSGFSNDWSVELNGVDEYVKSGSAYTLLNGATQASFSVWVKPISAGSALRYVFQIGRGSTGHNSQCQLFLYEGNRIDFSIYTSSYYGRGDISSITYGAWNHILITIDLPSATEFKIYVNGVDETISDNMSTRTSFPNATDELYVGESETGNYHPFNGNIDEFAIWEGTVLTGSDAATLYNSGTPTNLATFSTVPDLWWRMGDNDGGSGTTVTGQGSSPVDGTLINAANFDSDAP